MAFLFKRDHSILNIGGRRGMTDKLKARRPLTLGQFTLDLQLRAAEQANIQAANPTSQALSENAIACQVALGLAKRRADQ
jgi:hypothetical protein